MSILKVKNRYVKMVAEMKAKSKKTSNHGLKTVQKENRRMLLEVVDEIMNNVKVGGQYVDNSHGKIGNKTTAVYISHSPGDEYISGIVFTPNDMIIISPRLNEDIHLTNPVGGNYHTFKLYGDFYDKVLEHMYSYGCKIEHRPELFKKLDRFSVCLTSKPEDEPDRLVKTFSRVYGMYRHLI